MLSYGVVIAPTVVPSGSSRRAPRPARRQGKRVAAANAHAEFEAALEAEAANAWRRGAG